MARYLVRHSYVDIIGGIWWPFGAMCAMRKDLSPYDIANIKAYDEDNKITRDGLDLWLTSNSGDFSSLKDFRASVEDGNDTVDIPFADMASEDTYTDCMYPAED